MAQLDASIVAGQLGHINDHEQIHRHLNEVFNPLDFGAAGDGTTDDTTAVQDAINECLEAGGGFIYAPGTYRLTSGLTMQNTSGGHAAAPMFVGDGRGLSVLLADFDNDAILDVDGASDTPQKFFWFGGIKGVTFKQASGRTGVRGIRHNGWWRPRLEQAYITGLSSDAIYFPDRSGDISSNVDLWASQAWLMEGCQFDSNSGWGLNTAGGVGWGSSILRGCGFSLNAGGGLTIAGHAWRVENCTISANGNTGEHGLFVERQLGVNPHNLIVEGCEFDGNYSFHVMLDGLIGGRFHHNRFIHHEDNHWSDNTNRPVTGVSFGRDATSATAAVQSVEFARNHHRSDTALGTAVTAYRFEHVNAGAYSRIVDDTWGTNTAALTKFSGYNDLVDSQEPFIRDLGVVINPEPATYTASNVTVDRSFDANATTTDELADVVGSLIADLRAQGLVL